MCSEITDRNSGIVYFDGITYLLSSAADAKELAGKQQNASCMILFLLHWGWQQAQGRLPAIGGVPALPRDEPYLCFGQPQRDL
jgi:hypothetical protein